MRVGGRLRIVVVVVVVLVLVLRRRGWMGKGFKELEKSKELRGRPRIVFWGVMVAAGSGEGLHMKGLEGSSGRNGEKAEDGGMWEDGETDGMQNGREHDRGFCETQVDHLGERGR